MKLETKKIIFIKENIFASWAKDIFTFGIMFLMFYLNHKFTDGSWVIDLTIGILIIFTIVGIFSRKEKTINVSKAIEILRKMNDVN